MAASRVSVKVRNGNVNKALSIFKKKVISSGILQEYKDRQEYIKPSLRKREKLKKAIREQKRKDKLEK